MDRNQIITQEHIGYLRTITKPASLSNRKSGKNKVLNIGQLIRQLHQKAKSPKGNTTAVSIHP